MGLGVGVSTIEIEVVCFDIDEHRRRVETRKPDIPDFTLPTWEEVCSRNSEPWPRERVVIDTAGRAVEDCLAELRAALPG